MLKVSGKNIGSQYTRRRNTERRGKELAGDWIPALYPTEEEDGGIRLVGELLDCEGCLGKWDVRSEANGAYEITTGHEGIS